jgi:hypothetical protein
VEDIACLPNKKGFLKLGGWGCGEIRKKVQVCDATVDEKRTNAGSKKDFSTLN